MFPFTNWPYGRGKKKKGKAQQFNAGWLPPKPLNTMSKKAWCLPMFCKARGVKIVSFCTTGTYASSKPAITSLICRALTSALIHARIQQVKRYLGLAESRALLDTVREIASGFLTPLCSWPRLPFLCLVRSVRGSQAAYLHNPKQSRVLATSSMHAACRWVRTRAGPSWTCLWVSWTDDRLPKIYPGSPLRTGYLTLFTSGCN